MTLQPKKRTTYHHGDLRETLLTAALEAIDKHGLASLSLHQISRAAGVSAGAPYHHFASREVLLNVLTARGFELLTRYMSEGRDAAGPDARARFEGVGRGYVRFAVENPGYFRIVFRPETRELGDKELRNLRARAFAIPLEAIIECQKMGLAPEGDPRKLQVVAWAVIHGASTLWVDGPLAHFLPSLTAEAMGTMMTQLFASLLAGAAGSVDTHAETSTGLSPGGESL